MIDKTYYQIYRSRNKGNFWSNITHGMELEWEEAQHLMENEKTKHPSDWLRLVKVQVTTEDEYLGNSYKKESPIIHGMIEDPHKKGHKKYGDCAG